jgi:Cu+-exporting ATPase
MEKTREKIEIEIPDMNCASCVAKVEKKLNQVEGAEATVNFATKKASVEFDPDLADEAELEAAVDAAGYTPFIGGNGSGSHPVAAVEGHEPGEGHEADVHDHMSHQVASLASLKARLAVSRSALVRAFLLLRHPFFWRQYAGKGHHAG